MAASLIEWSAFSRPADYVATAAAMEARAHAIAAGEAAQAVWALEHPPLYTMGTSADPAELIDATRFAVHKTGRGGRFTYHGPGQRVLYTLLDLREHGRDVRAFVHALEEIVIETLAAFDIVGERRRDRVGVWVVSAGPDGPVEHKIAAIGVRLRRWVSFHGLAINVAPNLEHFSGIVPCGVADHGVTSLAALGRAQTMGDVDAVLRQRFEATFGPTIDAPEPQSVVLAVTDADPV